MSLARIGIIALVIGLASSLTPRRTALAQDAEEADERARTLFDQATTKLDGGDLPGALSDYRAAYALAPRAKILLNIGAVLLELGRTVEAANTFADYLARDDADPDRVQAVRDTLAGLDRSLGVISLDVAIAAREVLLDDVAIGSSPLRQTLRAAPGRHVVVLRAGDGARASYPVDVIAAGNHQLVIANPTLEPPPAPAIAPGPAATATSDSGRPSLWRRPVVWTGVATGLALTAGVVFGLQARAFESDLDALNTDSANHPFADAAALEQRARDRALFANIGFITAGITGAVTAVLLVRGGPSPSRASVRTTLIPGGAQLGVEVRY